MEKVSMNPSRCGFIDCLKKMGADIQLRNKTDYFEPYADIVASSSQLKGISIDPQQVPLMIDEVPILLVCAAFAQGTTIINGVKELIVKETNRIESMVSNLRKAGIDIEAVARDDDWLIKVNAKGSDFVRRQDGNINFKSFADHRTAMSLIVFSMASGGDNYIDQLKCIDKSFPDFLKIVKLLKSDAIS
jgi:3-phosphoshikimate 1-carboxyvinyltransferase